MTDESQGTPPEGESPPPSEGGGEKIDYKAAGNAALGEALSVLLKPDEALPKVVKSKGFVMSGILIGAFIVVPAILMMLGTGLSFRILIHFVVAGALFAAAAAGIIFGLSRVLAKREDVGLDTAANVVAISTIPLTAALIVASVLSWVGLDQIGGMVAMAGACISVIYMATSLIGGLSFSIRDASHIATVAYVVGLLLYYHFASTGIASAMAGEMERAMEEAFEDAMRNM